MTSRIIFALAPATCRRDAMDDVEALCLFCPSPGEHDLAIDLRRTARIGFCNAAGVRAVEDILTWSRALGLEVTMSVHAHLDWLLRLVCVDVAGLAQVDVVPSSRTRTS